MNKFLMPILVMLSFNLLKSMEERENQDNNQKTYFLKKEKNKKESHKKHKISSIFGILSGILGSRRTLKDNSNLRALPIEIKTLLIECLFADATEKEQLAPMFKDLKNLSYTNKYFYNLLNDYNIVKHIIRILNKSTGISKSKLALMLGTKGACDWLKEDKGINFLVKQIDNYKNEKNIELIEFLVCVVGLDLEKKINEEEMTVLMLAAREGHLEIVKLLIENGAKINAQDKNGDTSLMYALKSADSCDCNTFQYPCTFSRIIDYLIYHQADILLENNSGQSVYTISQSLSPKHGIIKLTIAQERALRNNCCINWLI